MIEVWADTNRFNQSGYSSPTLFPIASNYSNLQLYAEDLVKAEARQESHLEWVWEEECEARQEYLEQQAETKAERGERGY